MSGIYNKLNQCGRYMTKLFYKDVQRILITRNIGTAARAPPNYLRLSLIGLGLGAITGTGLSIYQLNKTTTHIVNDQTPIPLYKTIPPVTPTKKVIYPGDQSGLNLTLYQYQTCPFCCKVRAFLDYYGISYNIVEVDPVLRQSIKWSPYKKVPILVARTEQGYQPLNDSSMIISALQSYLQEDRDSLVDIVQYYPSITYEEDGKRKSDIMNKYFLMFNDKKPDRKKEDMDEERKWRQWVDDVLVHIISPNVYRTTDEALQAFNWFSDTGEWDKHFPAWERYMMIYVGAGAMWLIGKRLKKRHNLRDDVRQSFYDECNKFAVAVKNKGTKFLGGDEPNLADISLYGVLSSIEGCDAFRDLLRESKIKNWYFHMKEVVRNHKGSNFASYGAI